MSRFGNLLLVLASVGVALVLVEVALRLVPNPYARLQRQAVHDPSTVAYRSLDGDLFTLAPGSNLRFRTACTDVTSIAVNEDGFRGPPWPPRTDRPRLVFLGDSFIAALQVDATESVGALVARATGTQVLEAGVGGYSTVTELLAYRRLVRGHRPDVLVLFAFAGNDVRANSCALAPGQGPCGVVDGSQVAFRTQPPHEASTDDAPGSRAAPASAAPIVDRVKTFLRRNLVLYQALHDLRMMVEGTINHVLGRVPPRWQVYLDPPSTAWDAAWQATEAAIRALRDEQLANGGRLAVVAIPEPFVTAPDWKRKLILGGGTGVPASFDPRWPARRLGEIASRLDVPFLDLTAVLAAYRREHDLPAPYFAFACDGHWNPLGHRLAAAAVASFLAEHRFLPGSPEAASLRRALDDLLTRSPEKILGDRAFRQIYRGGVYRPGD